MNATLKKLVRDAAGAPRMPIKVVDGAQRPTVRGSPWYWETGAGKVIQHPCAYAMKGWSNMRYVHSTRCTHVGRDWLLARDDIAWSLMREAILE